MRTALVVDDNDINRILAVKLLSKAEWTVAEASCGEDAITWLRANTADLVLLDISMPTMSGQDVCRLIREGGLGGAGVKVVAYTAHAMNQEVTEFLSSGFDTVLLKPLSRGRLSEMLTNQGFCP